MPIPAAVPIAIGVAGALKNMFSKGPHVPTLADINLQRDNPELWKELENLRAMTGEMERMYGERRQGATSGEMAGQAKARSSMNEQLGNLGLVGSSAGASAMGAFEAQQQDALQQRIFQEQMALMQAQQQAQQNYIQSFDNAQRTALGVGQSQVQDHRQEQQGQNQFFGGLVNAGMNLYGTNQYLNTMRAPPSMGAMPMGNYNIPSIPANFGGNGYQGYRL